MSVKDKFIKCLQELKNCNYTDSITARTSDSKVEDALNYIYQASLNKTSFTPQEKILVGSLLANAITPIQINIECTDCTHRTRLENVVLMKRSALQYLIDEYGQFPVENTNLATKLKEANIAESVEILDDIIAKYCDLSDSEEGSSDREEAGSKEVPTSHTWWTA